MTRPRSSTLHTLRHEVLSHLQSAAGVSRPGLVHLWGRTPGVWHPAVSGFELAVKESKLPSILLPSLPVAHRVTALPSHQASTPGKSFWSLRPHSGASKYPGPWVEQGQQPHSCVMKDDAAAPRPAPVSMGRLPACFPGYCRDPQLLSYCVFCDRE